jgi:hypothetical protein
MSKVVLQNRDGQSQNRRWAKSKSERIEAKSERIEMGRRSPRTDAGATARAAWRGWRRRSPAPPERAPTFGSCSATSAPLPASATFGPWELGAEATSEEGGDGKAGWQPRLDGGEVGRRGDLKGAEGGAAHRRAGARGRGGPPARRSSREGAVHRHGGGWRWPRLARGAREGWKWPGD